MVHILKEAAIVLSTAMFVSLCAAGVTLAIVKSQKSCPDERVVVKKYQDRVVELWP